MNWRTTGIALLVFGAVIGVVGLVYRHGLHVDKGECRTMNVASRYYGGGTVDCASTMPGTVIALVGGVLAVIGLAITIGGWNSAPEVPLGQKKDPLLNQPW